MISYYLLLVEDDKKDIVAYIYQNYYKYMLYKAKSIVNNESHCEDIVHDSMLKIIKNINLIDSSDKNKLKNLCIIMAEQTAIDFLRTTDVNCFPLDDVDWDGADDKYEPERYLIEKAGVEQIIEAIYKLSDTYRLPCELKYLHGYKEREIASLLGLTPKVVNARIFRGKKLLRKYVEDAAKKK